MISQNRIGTQSMDSAKKISSYFTGPQNVGYWPPECGCHVSSLKLIPYGNKQKNLCLFNFVGNCDHKNTPSYKLKLEP